jgi:hypothetical protein
MIAKVQIVFIVSRLQPNAALIISVKKSIIQFGLSRRKSEHGMESGTIKKQRT